VELPAFKPVVGPDEPHAPLWSQVKTALAAVIAREGLAEHARLPSEAQLCAHFGVSRTVVREAMSQLVRERLIYKRQGKGAFVAARRDQQKFIGTVVGFSGELIDKQRQVTRQILRQEITPADPAATAQLRLSPEAEVVIIERLLSVDGVPRMWVETQIPQGLVPGLEQVPMRGRSLYETLSRNYGLVLRRAERWIEAVMPTAEQAALLGVDPGESVLAIESCTFGDADLPLEYYRALYRTSQARLQLTISVLN
jgi:GntR family transcriptional regulator